MRCRIEVQLWTHISQKKKKTEDGIFGSFFRYRSITPPEVKSIKRFGYPLVITLVKLEDSNVQKRKREKKNWQYNFKNLQCLVIQNCFGSPFVSICIMIPQHCSRFLIFEKKEKLTKVMSLAFPSFF